MPSTGSAARAALADMPSRSANLEQGRAIHNTQYKYNRIQYVLIHNTRSASRAIHESNTTRAARAAQGCTEDSENGCRYTV